MRHALAVSCRGGEFALWSVSIATTCLLASLRPSDVIRHHYQTYNKVVSSAITNGMNIQPLEAYA